MQTIVQKHGKGFVFMGEPVGKKILENSVRRAVKGKDNPKTTGLYGEMVWLSAGRVNSYCSEPRDGSVYNINCV